jgi:hypothetical protein
MTPSPIKSGSLESSAKQDSLMRLTSLDDRSEVDIVIGFEEEEEEVEDDGTLEIAPEVETTAEAELSSEGRSL